MLGGLESLPVEDEVAQSSDVGSNIPQHSNHTNVDIGEVAEIHGQDHETLDAKKEDTSKYEPQDIDLTQLAINNQILIVPKPAPFPPVLRSLVEVENDST